jgi:hypothetical protein
MILLNDDLIASHLTDLAMALAVGRVKAYTAPKPARGAAITSQTLIGTANLGASPEVSGTQLSFPDIGPLGCVAGGTISWVRFENSAGQFVADGTVGLPGSGADVELSVLEVQAGWYVDWDSAAISYPTS